METGSLLPDHQGRPIRVVPSWPELVTAFLEERAARTGSRRTVETYGRTIRRFLRTVDSPASATPIDVHRFAYALTGDARPPAPSTILTRLAAVGGMYKFAVAWAPPRRTRQPP